MNHRFPLLVAALLLAAGGAAAPLASPAHGPGLAMDILVKGSRLPTYAARGALYIEALEGREYEIRLRNPYPVRVAVALSVDGLNTIDARRTTAAEARKWVIEPYGTITISGWQTSMTHARRFEFTTEERSYGAWLGTTKDLGVISAVCYRERVPERLLSAAQGGPPRSEAPAAAGRADAKAIPAGEAGAPPSPSSGAEPASRAQAAAVEEYAATGIGRPTDHAVRQVHLDLESRPAAAVSIRYEYRSQLVRLGVLPARQADLGPLDRRERAKGFDAFCPEPKR
jgi:hypothetical protein